MSLTAARTFSSSPSTTPSGPRTSPARIIRCVVTMVSHATRASGSAPKNASTTVSEMRSATLSGWPSETLSLVNTYELLATPRSETLRAALLRAIQCAAQRGELIALAGFRSLFGQGAHQLQHFPAHPLAADRGEHRHELGP